MEPLHVMLHCGPDSVSAAGAPVRSDQIRPLPTTFDAALVRIARLPDVFWEPDGFFLWGAGAGEQRWQISGNLYDNGAALAYVECKLTGPIPGSHWNQLLGCFGSASLLAQLVRQGIYVPASSVVE